MEENSSDDSDALIYVKLATGVDLIGELLESDDPASPYGITIINPMIVSLTERGGIGFFSLTRYTYISETVTLNNRFILQTGPVVTQLANLYYRHSDAEMTDISDRDLEELLSDEMDSDDLLSDLFQPKKIVH